MARPARPEADPVRVVAGGKRIAYYPSGFVGHGARRFVSCAPGAAETAAALLRAELLAKRKVSPLVQCTAPRESATVMDSYEMWLVSPDILTEGTRKRYRSACNKWFSLIGANSCAELDLHLWSHPLKQAVAAGVALNTYESICTAMRSWRTWAHREGWLPMSVLGDDRALTNEQNRLRKRLVAHHARLAASTQAEPGSVAEANLRTVDVPSADLVEELADCIYMVHVERAPWLTAAGRGSAGGPRPLDHDTAWRLSQGPLAQMALGLRECELLSLRSSNIDRKTGQVTIKSQLNRYEPWGPSGPDLVPPKGGRARVTQCWAWYLPTLCKLAEYADEHLDGWLFAPTRGQGDWAHAWNGSVDRGIRLLEWNRGNRDQDRDARSTWTWKPHFLRHAYGSWSLAPTEVGGYGWPLALVSERMGHSTTDQTSRTYHHRVGNDDAFAFESSRSRPGA